MPPTSGFSLLQNKSYYIPGDAIIYGTMNNGQDDTDGNFIRIFGHGTLSPLGLPERVFKLGQTGQRCATGRINAVSIPTHL